MAEGPYGAITADRRTRRDVLLTAGGVGITPMRALFESMPLPAEQDLLLLYRARTAATSSSGPSTALTAQLLLQLVPNLPERDVYMCGSPGFTGATR